MPISISSRSKLALSNLFMFRTNMILLCNRDDYRNVNWTLLCLFFCLGRNHAVIPICSENFKGCCLGYIWNSTINMCDKCISGYTGPNCTSICPYPTYGDNCQHICDCSKDECDYSSGCNSLTSEKQTFYLSTTKFDSPFSESFTIRNTKPDFSSNHIILFQKRNQTVLIILTIICFICACIIFAKIVVWFHDGRRRGPGNAPNTV